MESLQTQFRSFVSKSFDDPNEIPAGQLTEMRRVFFAGAWSVLCSLKEQEMAYERQLAEIAMRQECQTFVRSVQKGEA